MLNLLRSRLSLRLLLAFLLASLVPVLGGGWLTSQALARAAQSDAAKRQDLVAAAAAALVTETVHGAEAKLDGIARIIEEELAAARLPADAPASILNGLVMPRLEANVDSADAYLELQYYSSNSPAPYNQVAQAQQTLLIDNEPQLFNAEPSAVGVLAGGPVVQEPLSNFAPFRGGTLEVIEGVPTMHVSRPVAEPQGPGALVAALDFRGLRERLSAVASDDFEVQVEDGIGTALAEVGAVEEPTAWREVEVAELGWTVRVREPSARVDDLLADQRRQVFLWCAVAVLLSSVLGLALSTWIARPLARLRGAAEAMEGGDLKVRANIARADEIGALGHAFDRMAAALDQLDEAKSEFIGNVSHELRTPVTALRASVGNLLDGVVGELTGPQRATLERIDAELVRMAAMVDEMLELARLDVGAEGLRRETTDLAELAGAVVETLAGEAASRGASIVVEGSGRAQVDPRLVRRVLTNLLENALKFGPEGQTVRVTLEGGRIEVRDQGPGFGDSVPFERFRQGQQRGVKNPGVGLGLAIVRRIAELHGGSVTARDEGGGVVAVDLGGHTA